MTPEEKFNREVWLVLQKIRWLSISTRKGEALEWVMQGRPIMGMPPIGVRQRTLLKIEEWGGVKIIKKEVVDVTYGKDFIYTLELLQPKFNELYRLYESGVDYRENKKNETAHNDIPEGSEEYKEKISLLRKTYQALMGVVEVFCRNFSRLSHEDIVELNKYYLALDKVVWGVIYELKLGGTFDVYKKYPRPFTNLFSAEKELNGEINWDVIRREMSARFGEIETLYQRVNASDILAEPDKQKQLNDVMLYLSELKEKNKAVKKQEKIEATPTTKIEIMSLPELRIKGLGEGTISQKSNRPSEKLETHSIPDRYEISVKDREIWVNKYLIGKPHAVGSNFEFFEYIRSQKPNTKINREALPNFGGSLSLKEQVKSKSFIKIVNELGFKGEILKAFFYSRGKDTLTYRGDQITREDLEKAGVKKSLFLKELELAHTRNSPE